MTTSLTMMAATKLGDENEEEEEECVCVGQGAL